VALWLSSLMVVVLVMGALKTPPHDLAEVYTLLGGVRCRVVLSFAGGLRDACLLLGLVMDRPSAECKRVAGAGLACAAVIRPVGVGEACELEAVVGSPPFNVKRKLRVPLR
jgi:hypothetical protein